MEEERNLPVKRTRKERSQLKSRMGNFLMFLPNLVRLLGRLLKDSRVSTADKALFAAAIVYVIVPLDFIPDVFPFFGQVDDLYLVALSLLRLLNRTDERIVREHWDGGGDITSLANSIANIAPMLLPKRVTRVLSAKVDLAPGGKNLEAIANKREAVLVEVPQIENKREKSKIPSPS
ncbi:MAG TPA: YkvA family protein [Pyrinomonadaceae bacterium]|nr:YkvA family protein [Pyrinomonadaceae bacterium]